MIMIRDTVPAWPSGSDRDSTVGRAAAADHDSKFGLRSSKPAGWQLEVAASVTPRPAGT